jgi:hypothetical protein
LKQTQQEHSVTYQGDKLIFTGHYINLTCRMNTQALPCCHRFNVIRDTSDKVDMLLGSDFLHHDKDPAPH